MAAVPSFTAILVMKQIMCILRRNFRLRLAIMADSHDSDTVKPVVLNINEIRGNRVISRYKSSKLL